MIKFVLILLNLVAIAFPLFAQEKLVLSRSEGSKAVISERVVSEAYKRLGIQVKIEKSPTKRALTELNHGKLDGAVSRVKGLEKSYSNLIRVPIVVSTFEAVVFSKNDTLPITGWDSLKPYNIGIKRGMKFAEMGTKGMKTYPVDKSSQLFQMLNLGRVDLIVISRAAGLLALKQTQLQDIHMLALPVARIKLYHYLHKKNAAIVPRITKALQDMENEGRIEEIRMQAIIEDRNKHSTKEVHHLSVD